MATTLGETAPAVTDQLGAEALACRTGDAEGAELTDVWAVCAATSVRVTAYVPALASTAATRAMAAASASLRGLADWVGLAPGCVTAAGRDSVEAGGTTGEYAGN